MKTMKSPWHYCKVECFDNLWHKKRDFWIKNLPETDWIMLKEYESDGLLMEISEKEFEEDSEHFDHTWIHDPGSWEPRQRFFKRIQVDECPVTEKEERESKSVSIFERLGFTKEELGLDKLVKRTNEEETTNNKNRKS